MYSMPKMILGSVSNMRIWFEISSTLSFDDRCSVGESTVSDVLLSEISWVFIEVLSE